MITFNSIEWIQGKHEVIITLEGARLSIPLNGFVKLVKSGVFKSKSFNSIEWILKADIAVMIKDVKELLLSIPLNGFEEAT